VLAALVDTRVVLVIDHAEELLGPDHQIRDSALHDVLRELARSRDHLVRVLLVSSRPAGRWLRGFPTSVFTIRVDAGLETTFARDFLKDLDQHDSIKLESMPSGRIDDLIRLSGGQPRTLELIYGSLLDPHTNSRQLIDALSRVELQQRRALLVDRMVQRLDDGDLDVVLALAAFGRAVTADAVAYLLQQRVDRHQVETILGDLLQTRLIRRTEVGRYFLPGDDPVQVLGRIPRGTAQDRGLRPTPITQLGLLHRAAGYFAARAEAAPRFMEDLAPQLMEIELRLRGGEYTVALALMAEADQHLYNWGHSHALATWREKVRGQLDSLHAEVHNLSALGRAWAQQGKYDEAIEFYEKALSCNDEGNDRRNGVHLRIQRSSALFNDGQATRAATGYRAALALAIGLNMAPQQAKALSGLSLCLTETGRFTEAIEHQARALNIAERSESPETIKLIAQLRLNRGETLSNIAEYEQARQNFVQARADADEAGDQILLASCDEAEAALCLDQGLIARALELAQQAAKVGSQLGNMELSLRADSTLAWAHLRNDNFESALAAARAAVRFGGRRDLGPLALAAIIALHRNRLDDAQGSFLQAKERAEKLHRKEPDDFQVLDTLGLVLAGLMLCRDDDDDENEAIAAYRKARGITAETGVVDRVLRELDELPEQGDPGRLDRVKSAARGVVAPSPIDP
jgi:tetratricopeptide (TPR) repeat protein